MRKAFRVFSTETGSDLKQWVPWDVPDKHGGCGPADVWTEIPFTPPPGGRTFFRFHVAEP